MLPSYFRLLPGNIKEVKAFKLCMEESGAANARRYNRQGISLKANLEFS